MAEAPDALLPVIGAYEIGSTASCSSGAMA
jgi:hypothetical protein